jgi:hypothetical protein
MGIFAVKDNKVLSNGLDEVSEYDGYVQIVGF